MQTTQWKEKVSKHFQFGLKKKVCISKRSMHPKKELKYVILPKHITESNC